MGTPEIKRRLVDEYGLEIAKSTLVRYIKHLGHVSGEGGKVWYPGSKRYQPDRGADGAGGVEGRRGERGRGGKEEGV